MTAPESPVSATVVTPAGPASRPARARRRQKLLGRARGLELAQPPDPGGEIRRPRPGRSNPVSSRWVWVLTSPGAGSRRRTIRASRVRGRGHALRRPDRRDPPVGADQDRAVRRSAGPSTGRTHRAASRPRACQRGGLVCVGGGPPPPITPAAGASAQRYAGAGRRAARRRRSAERAGTGAGAGRTGPGAAHRVRPAR